jgi:hypothetical protein
MSLGAGLHFTHWGLPQTHLCDGTVLTVGQLEDQDKMQLQLYEFHDDDPPACW